VVPASGSLRVCDANWSEITRPKYQRDGLRYASETADAERAVFEPHVPT
jgi:hypothetical protein